MSMSKLHNSLRTGLAGIALLMAAGHVSAQDASTPETIAHVDAVEGTAFVTRNGGRQGILARNSVLKEGESINTSSNSTVRVKFNDGSVTVLRPESRLQIESFKFKGESPNEDNLLISLIKGGMRAITGAIGKRGNLNAYQLRVNTATVGIRGTEYSVRLCQTDCSTSAQSKEVNSGPPVVGRVAVLQGAATVQHAGKPELTMEVGTPLYKGDFVSTGASAYALLVFRDDSRMTVNPASRIEISDYAYEPDGAKSIGSMLVTLLKGGLRAATGLIGKRNYGDVKFRTATATIGIRGTVFDLLCAPNDSSDRGAPEELADMPCEESLFAQTRTGIITLANASGSEIEIPSGASGRIGGLSQSPRPLSATPLYFQRLTSPMPETIQVDLQQTFGQSNISDSTPGIFLTVHEGKVILEQEGKDLMLDAGESAYAGTGLPPIRIQAAPVWMSRDPFLSNTMYSAFMCRR